MNRQDARQRASRAPRWKVVSLLSTGLAMLAVCLAVRYFWGSRAAHAQGNAKFKPESSSTEKPAASTSAAGGTKSSAGSKPAATKTAAKGASSKSAGSAAVPADDDRKMELMAVVNGEQITRQDLANECLLRYGNDVIETMVNKHLILAACKQRGIVVTEEEVNEEIARLAAKFGLSPDRWLKLLEEQRNVNPTQYAKDIIWPTLAMRKVAADKIKVTPAELKKGMESEFGPRVRVRIIASTDRGRAEKLRKRALADPEAFGDIAKDSSEDQLSASARGMIPPIRKHVGDPALEKTAFGLKEGEISPVIEVMQQFIILKCEKHEPATFIAPEHRKDAEDRLTDQLSDKKLHAAGEKLFEELQKSSKVVNVFNDKELSKQMPGVAATINGAQITMRQLAEECLMRHGLTVLDGEINRLLLKQELAKRKKTVTKKDLDEEVVRAARSRGFEKNGKVQIEEWLKTVTAEEGATEELYLKDAVWPTVALKQLVGNSVTVTPEDLDKAYQANYGERVEVLAIVLSSHRQAQTVWDMARGTPTDEFFAKLAAQYSIEPASKANGGKVPPIQRFGGQKQLEDEAFKLKPGELSSIIVLDNKFIVLRCLGRTKPVSVKRSIVEPELRADLAEKKLRMEMGKQFDKLKDEAQVDNFLAGTSKSPKKDATTARGKSGAVSPDVAPAGFNQPGSPGAASGSRSGSAIRPSGSK